MAPQRILWTLLDLIDDNLADPWCPVLSTHLGNGDEGHRVGRRYATAEQIRDLFRAYGSYRPAMLVDWAQHSDTDGNGGQLDADLLWQAELWRRLRRRLDTASPAERLEETCLRLRSDPGLSELPARLSVFGATRMTTEQRAIVRALSEHRDVRLWLPHASPGMWTKLANQQPVIRRRDDRTAERLQHPLLASLARDTRELQQLLVDVATVQHAEREHASSSLLRQVQAAIRDDVAPSLTATADGTVQVHSCHGAPRQVEVLREALLHLFATVPELEPRDVIVMCPDIETYAPLIRAAFGLPGTGHPGHGLRVRLADRSLRRTNPLLEFTSGLLTLADGRVTASQVLDLAATPPVRRRFGFDDDDLGRLRDWVGSSGVRWGLGPQQRQAYKLGSVPQNTWKTGLNRILLGVAADETEPSWLGITLPLDDVDSSDIDLAGRVADFVDRLDLVLGTLQEPKPVAGWVEALRDALDLLTDVPEDDAWQALQARRQLTDAAEHGGSAVLRLPDVAVHDGRQTRRPSDQGELPQRRTDRLHHGADALRAAPGHRTSWS